MMIVVVILLAIACAAHADPFVSSVSGSSAEGDTLTITGTGFGTKNPAAPDHWDNLEGGTHGLVLSDVDARYTRSLTSIPDSRYYNPTPQNPELAAYSGSLVAMNRRGQHADPDSNYDARAVSHVWYAVPTDTVYFTSTYMWVNQNAEATDYNGVMKMARTNVGTDTYNGDGRILLSQMKNSSHPVDIIRGGQVYVENEHGTVIYSPGLEEMTQRKWYRVEMYKTNSTPGEPDGRVWARISGEAKSAADVYDQTGLVTKQADATWQNTNWSIGTGLQNFSIGEGGADFQCFVDDIYIDHTRARVEIIDASSYGSANIAEVQIPFAWSDTEISVVVRHGSFTASSDVWLVVIDADGNASAGFQVTLDGELESQGVGTPSLVLIETALSIEWTPPTDSVDHYEVYVAQDGVWLDPLEVVRGGEECEVTVTAGKDLTVYVKAINADGTVHSTSERAFQAGA